MDLNQATETSFRRLLYFTPLRYPGGKSKLCEFIKNILNENNLVGGHYVEPYAGGAGVALELLFHEYVSHIHINDISRPIHSFWDSVLNDTEKLVKLINDTKITPESWKVQKKILSNQDDYDDLKVGFATFFLNRTNRSGILKGGIIGGKDQTGPWKIDARYNVPELIHRVEAIAELREKISLTRLDAAKYIVHCSKKIDNNSLIYLDPPYYDKGKELYLNYYKHDDHEEISKVVKKSLKKKKWIISYDNKIEIRKMYKEYSFITYHLNYSAGASESGSEVMFFSKNLNIPEKSKNMKNLRKYLK